jgi:hypothetical protein
MNISADYLDAAQLQKFAIPEKRNVNFESTLRVLGHEMMLPRGVA